MGPLILISGPSGSGKSTVVSEVLKVCTHPLRSAVSVTTRPKRGYEQEGVHYHFWTREQFQEGLRQGHFLEWALVHDAYYGTPRSEVDHYRSQGIGVILIIDVQGASQIRQMYPDHLSIFLRVPAGEYERRIRDRGSEDEAKIRLRLETARVELARSDEYMVQLVNMNLDRTVELLRRLIDGEFAAG
jgi:guanylate kinase